MGPKNKDRSFGRPIYGENDVLTEEEREKLTKWVDGEKKIETEFAGQFVTKTREEFRTMLSKTKCPDLMSAFHIAVKLPNVYGIIDVQYLRVKECGVLGMTPAHFVKVLKETRAGTYFDILGLAIVDIDEPVHFEENMAVVVETYKMSKQFHDAGASISNEPIPVGRVQRVLAIGQPIGGRIRIDPEDDLHKLCDLGMVDNNNFAILVYPDAFNKQTRMFENVFTSMGKENMCAALDWYDPESLEYQRKLESQREHRADAPTESSAGSRETAGRRAASAAGGTGTAEHEREAVAPAYQGEEHERSGTWIEELDGCLEQMSTCRALVPLSTVHLEDPGVPESAARRDHGGGGGVGAVSTEENGGARGGVDLAAARQQYKADAMRCVQALAAERDAEDLVRLSEQLRVGHKLMSAMFENGDSCVSGDARKRLRNVLPTGEKKLQCLREALRDPEEFLRWASANEQRRLDRVKNAFSVADQTVVDAVREQVRKRQCNESSNRYIEQSWGSAVVGAEVLKTIDSVAAGRVTLSPRQRMVIDGCGRPPRIPLLADGYKPGKQDFVFAHLARVLLLLEENPESRSAAAAVNAFGCALFALAYPEVVAKKQTKTILSGMPLDPRQDDEQSILHFYWDGEAPRVALLDDAQMRITQKRWTYSDASAETLAAFSLSAHRVFAVSQPDTQNFANIVVEDSAFVAYSILCPHLELDQLRSTLRAMNNAVLDEHEIARHFLESQTQAGHGGAFAGTTEPGDTFTRADFDWFVEAARHKRSIMIAGVHFGQRGPPGAPAYSSLARRICIEDQDIIAAVVALLEKTSQAGGLIEGSAANDGIIPWLLPPAVTDQDYALERMFWECLEDGRTELVPREVVELLLIGCADEEEADLVAEVLEQQEEQEVVSDSALAWLRDPKLRKEQRARAEQVRCEWMAKKLGVSVPSPDLAARLQKQGGGAFSSVQQDPSAAGGRTGDAGDVEERRAQARQLLDRVARKRNKLRNVVRGMNVLRRLGLLQLAGDGRNGVAGVRVTVKGSHHVIHGPSGAATLVRDHRGTPALSDRLFIARMERVADVCS